MKTLITLPAIALIMAGCASSKIEPPPLLNGGKGHPGDFRRVDTVRVGDMAPDFKLKTLDGKRTVRLHQFRGQRPVVLIFGSYT
jgi:hypothetical protein